MATEKTVGVIGGLGPEATIDFYRKLLAKSNAATDQDHLHVLINSNPKVPDRQKALAGTGPSSGPALVKTAQVLERAGAEFLVMVCNTAHAYEQDIREATAIPFISILSESVNASLRLNPQLKRAGLMAATGCVGARLYQTRFEATGVDCVVPNSAEQATLMQLIYRIKSGDHAPDIADQMRQLANTLIERGAEIILAACTEIPLALKQNDIEKPLLDCTDVLVDATIAFAYCEAS